MKEDDIVLGEWLYDEKPEPELAKADLWRPDKPRRPLAKKGDKVTINRSLIKQGVVHVRGKTRSGKTTRMLIRLALALMLRYRLRWNELGKTRWEMTHDAVVFIDLGGTLEAYHAFIESAKRLGRTVRFFSLDPSRSHHFDPFQSSKADGNRLIQICNLWLEGLFLFHGMSYGPAWYSSRNMLLMLSVLKELSKRKKRDAKISIRDVETYLNSPGCPHIKDAEMLRGIFAMLVEYDNLIAKEDDSTLIDLIRCIEDGECVYFFLSSIGESTTARQIAGLVLYTLVNAAMRINQSRQGHAKPQRHVHVILDEGHLISSPTLESLITGAAKFSVSFIFAHQTSENLTTRDADLLPVIRDNAVCRIYFTCTGKRDIEELLTFSRETTRPLQSRGLGGTVRLLGRSALGRDSESEQITRQTSLNELLDLSAFNGASVTTIDDGLGHREPIPMFSDFVLTEQQHYAYNAKPLPITGPIKENRLIGSDNPASSSPPWEQAHLATTKPKHQRDRVKRINALLTDLYRAEQLEI